MTRPAAFFFNAILLTSPWIGMGVVRLLTGRDTGAGFQPAYLLLAAALPCAWLADRRRCARTFPDWGPPVVLLLAAALVSLPGLRLHPGAVNPDQALMRYVKQVVQLIVMLGFMVLPVLWLDRPARWRSAARWLGAGLAVQVVYAACQLIHFHSPQPWFAALERAFTSNPSILAGSAELFLGDSFTGVPRLRGTACEPLYLGSYLLLAMPWIMLRPRGRARWALFGAGTVLLAATWSRGAWLAAVCGLAAWAALSWRSGSRPSRPSRRRAALIAAGCAAAVAAALLIIGPQEALMPWRRLLQSLDGRDWSNLTRFYSMQAAWRAFLLSPVIGVGWGQFGFHFPLLVDPTGLQSQFTWPVVNNFPLQILCETGLAGAAAALAAAAVFCRRAWAAVSPRAPLGTALGSQGRAAAVLGAAACFAIWVQLLSFSQYNLPHIWLAAGLFLAATRRPDREAEDVI